MRLSVIVCFHLYTSFVFALPKQKPFIQEGWKNTPFNFPANYFPNKEENYSFYGLKAIMLYLYNTKWNVGNEWKRVALMFLTMKPFGFHLKTFPIQKLCWHFWNRQKKGFSCFDRQYGKYVCIYNVGICS